MYNILSIYHWGTTNSSLLCRPGGTKPWEVAPWVKSGLHWISGIAGGCQQPFTTLILRLHRCQRSLKHKHTDEITLKLCTCSSTYTTTDLLRSLLLWIKAFKCKQWSICLSCVPQDLIRRWVEWRMFHPFVQQVQSCLIIYLDLSLDKSYKLSVAFIALELW